MKEKYNCRPVGPGLQLLLPAWLINITLINSKIELLFEIHVWSISEGIRQLQKRELLSWKTHYRDTSQVYCSPQEFYPNLSWAFTALLTLSIICRDVCQWECIEKTKNTTMKEDPPNGLALCITIGSTRIIHERLNAVDLLNVMRNGHILTVAVIACTMSLLKPTTALLF